MNPLSGPLNRIGYLAWSIMAFGIGLIFARIIDLTKDEHVGTYWLGWRVLVSILILGIIILASVRRLQSAGLHPLWLLLLFIPVVGFIFWVVLLFIPPKHKQA